MTGRVCEVHGEWCQSGVCRWCEVAPTESVELPGMAGQWRKPDRIEVNEAGVPSYFWNLGTFTVPSPTYMGVPVVVDDNAIDKFGPVLVSWERALGPPPKLLPDESAVAKAFREHLSTRYGMRPLFSTRQRYSTPEGIASHNAFWEAKLAAQHAALRWERVARRWATKAKFDGHERTVDGTLAFDDRCTECRRQRRLIESGYPKRWP